MRALLSTIGSRGDVQPIVALALALRSLGHDVHLCVPPDFREWIEGLGLRMTSIGPELRPTGKADPAVAPPTAEQRRQMIEGTVSAQFETIGAAAEGCDVIVGATALQIAAPSLAERLGVPYIFAAYCPTVIPSEHHAPPVLTMLGDQPTSTPAEYRSLWEADAQRWNRMWGAPLNSHRVALGLTPVADVRAYVLTKQPWLAADATLAPWPRDESEAVFQTGAWIVHDERALPDELETFLRVGDPPIYFGFGSISAPTGISRALIESARALGLRTIVSRGWAELPLIDDKDDCLSIGDVNHTALFKRVAAVVHHGGAGTTTAAARAGAPQVVLPRHYDQFYWASRVRDLGIGTSSTPDVLMAALDCVLQPGVASRAASIAAQVSANGALVAARALIERAVSA
jgi:vancomycin aglycone glucosyltransferase